MQAVARIDWRELRQQKQWLCNFGAVPQAEGLLSLLDAIQDAAVADGIADERTVFPNRASQDLS